ncbi:GNAT family N-acetyltransferase [Lentzea sp. NPDC004789]
MTMVTEPAETVGGYRVEVVRGVADVDRHEWNEVVRAGGGTIFHAWEWLAAFEEAPPGVFEPLHVLAYDGERLVGVCPAYLVHRCPRLDHVAGLAEIDFGGPVLLAHSLAAFAGGPLASPASRGALDALVSAVEQAAQRHDAWAWGFANLPGGPLVGRLLGRGYAAGQLSTTYVVDTRHASAQDYWGTIRGRHRRELARERKGLAHKGFTISRSTPTAEDHVRLVQALVADHGTPLELLPQNFLQALHRNLAPYDRTFVTTDQAGAVAAVFGGYEFGAEQSMWLAGLDVGRFSSFEFYRPMLAEVIESAIGSGTGLVNLGRANPAPKRRVGAVAVPLYLALSSSDRKRMAMLHAACALLESRVHRGTDGLDVVSRCC